MHLKFSCCFWSVQAAQALQNGQCHIRRDDLFLLCKCGGCTLCTLHHSLSLETHSTLSRPQRQTQHADLSRAPVTPGGDSKASFAKYRVSTQQKRAQDIIAHRKREQHDKDSNKPAICR